MLQKLPEPICISAYIMDIEETINHIEHCREFRQDFKVDCECSLTMRVPRIKDGKLTYEYLTEVTCVTLDYINIDDWQFVVYWYDGMDERSEYHYDELQVNLLKGIRYNIDVTDGFM